MEFVGGTGRCDLQVSHIPLLLKNFNQHATSELQFGTVCTTGTWRKQGSDGGETTAATLSLTPSLRNQYSET